jgi:O-antigen/teichoic acid export membrane protein
MSITRAKGRFAADVLKLTSGTVLAQVISDLAAPLIARLFAPEAFGVAALFTSVTGILAVVVCLRYDRSIIVPAGDEDAANLVGGSLFFVLLVSGLSMPLVFFGKAELVRRLNAPGLGAYLWLVPVNVFFLGVLAALNSWNTRKRHFTLITVAGVLCSACYVGFAIVSGAMGHASGGYLITGAFVGTVISALALAVQTWRECWPVLVKSVNLQRMLQVLHRYRRFPKYSTGAAILNTVSWELPAFFLSAFFSTTVVGQYALGNRLIRIPMSFIGLNISRVFSQRAAEARHEGTLAPLVDSTFQSLVAMGLFPFLLLIFIGKDLFGLVFGARWQEAGVFTEILSLWAFFWFISAPLSSVLDILDEQAFDLRINVLILATRFGSLLVGGYLGSPRMALILFSASGVLVYAYYCLAILNKCGLPVSQPFRVVWSHSVKFVPSGALIVVAKLLGLPSILILALSSILLAVYYLSLVRSDSAVREMVFGMIRRQPPRQMVTEIVN